MSQSTTFRPTASRPPVTFDRMYGIFPPITSPPARSHPVGYESQVFIPEPTDKDLGLMRAAEVHSVGHDLQDARMMAGLGDLFVPTAALAAFVFRAGGVPEQHREYMVLRVRSCSTVPTLGTRTSGSPRIPGCRSRTSSRSKSTGRWPS